MLRCSTQFELSQTQDSLLETLGVSVSADARVGLFAGGAKMSFSQQHSVNSSSTYIAGRSFVQNAIRHGRGFRLTEEAKAVLATGDMDAFKKAFGDMFVRSLFTGGEFCIIARVTSVSEEQQSKLAASLHGSYTGLVTNVEFQAALETANKETHNATDVTVKLFQSGGQGSQLSFTGQEATAIIERFKALPEIVHQHAFGLDAELASYDLSTACRRRGEEDRIIVLNDCAFQKTRFLRAI